MSLDEVKIGFIDYLIEKNIISEDESQMMLSSDISIFSHFDDFKDYLVDKNYADSSIFSKTISEIESMEFVGGKLVSQDKSYEDYSGMEIYGNEENTEILPGVLQGDEFVVGFNIATGDNLDVDGSEIGMTSEFEPELEMDTETEIGTETGIEPDIEPETGTEIDQLLDTIYSDPGFLQYLDHDGDGTISDEEKTNFEEFIKGDYEELTLETLEEAYNSMQDGTFNAQAFHDFVFGPQPESTDTPEVIDTPETEDVDTTQPPSSATGGSSGGGSINYTQSPSTTTTKPKTTAETVSEIEKEISDKNTEIGNVENDAEDKIKQEEAAKEQAMKEAGISEEEYKAYQEKEQEIEKNISEKEKAISDIDNDISDKKSTISSNENYISSIDAQIADNNSKKLSPDEENASEKNAEIAAKNEALEKEKARIEEENKQLQEAIDKAEEEKSQLESDKEDLEGQKEELLNETLDGSNGFGKGLNATEKAELKEAIQTYDSNISEIRAEKDKKVSELKADIQALQVKLKDVKAKEEREKTLQENTFNKGFGLTGEELVEVARQMLNKYGSSSGYCATGVSRTFAMAYGLNLHGNGCDWAKNMEKLVDAGGFREVTGDYATSADLANLPAGAVVCWDRTSNTGGGGAQYGHVTIADGRGGEISDHYCKNIITSVGGRRDTYRVFIPVT